MRRRRRRLAPDTLLPRTVEHRDNGKPFDQEWEEAAAYVRALRRQHRIAVEPDIPDVATITPAEAADALRFEMPFNVTDRRRHTGGAA